MDSHPQEGAFNIELCIAYGEKRLTHTETGAGKRCSDKKEIAPQAILWKIKSRHTHIKRKRKIGHE